MRSRCNIAPRSSISLRYILTAAVLLVTVAANLSAFQEHARKRVRSISDRFKLVEFVDKGFGWAAKDNSLWKTENGGKTWSLIKRASIRRVRDSFVGYREDANVIEHIQLLTRNNGWILEDSVLLHTTDGGLHWKKFDQSHLDIRSFRFVDESKGLFVAQRLHYGDDIDFSREAEIYRSSDAGVSWHNIPLKTRLQWTWLLDIWPASATNIWAVGDLILNSKDGGKTWREINIERGNGFYGRATRVKFSDSKRGWIEADGYAITTDGGKTWVPTTSNRGVDRLIYQKPPTRWRRDD